MGFKIDLNDKTAYGTPLAVGTFDVDRFDRLRMSSLLKMHQEVGERHIIEFGTCSKTLRENSSVTFIMTKTKAKIHRLPASEEQVLAYTWCSELKGIRFTRNYVLTDSNGEILTESKTELVMMDCNTRKIVRPNDVAGIEGFLYNTELKNGCEYPAKIKVPSEASCVCHRTARFSDIDFNGHVNNTVYADIVMDCLPTEYQKMMPESLEINYVNEVLQGEKMEISVFAKGNEVIVSGKVLDKQAFLGKIMFKI